MVSLETNRAQKLFHLRWIVIFGIALVVGALYLAPSLLIKRAIEKDGGFYLLPQQGLPTHSDSVIWYIPFAHEVAEGHFPAVDLFTPENRGMPFLLPPVPPLFFGALIALAGNANTAYLIAFAVFPPIIFLSFYWLGRKFFHPVRNGASNGVQDWLAATLFALVGIMTPVAIFYLERNVQLAPLATLKNFLPITRTPIPLLFLSRINEPLLTLPFFLLAFGFLYQFWRKPTPRRGAAAGALISLLIYIYLHYFIFLIAFVGLLFLRWLMFDRRVIKPWIFLFVTGVMMLLPFAINEFRLFHIPNHQEIIARWAGAALEYGRGFRISVWRDYALYAVFGFFIWLFRRHFGRDAIFWGVAIVTMFVLWNIQVILGFNLMVDHYYKAFGPPLYTLVAVLVGYLVSYARGMWPAINSWPRLWHGIMIILIVLLIGKRVVNASYYIHPDARTIKSFSFPSEVYDSWEWMNSNIPRDAVVISDSYVTSIYLVGYTSAVPYLPFAEETLLSTRDLEDRFLTTSKLFEVPADRLEFRLYGKYRKLTLCDIQGGCDNEDTSRNFLRDPLMLYGQVYTPQRHFDQLLRPVNQAIPPPQIEKLLERYRGLTVDWRKYSGAYVYYGPWERELNPIDFRNNPELIPLYQNEMVEIYRVR